MTARRIIGPSFPFLATTVSAVAGDIVTGLIHRWPLDDPNTGPAGGNILDLGSSPVPLTINAGPNSSGALGPGSPPHLATAKQTDGTLEIVDAGNIPMYDWNSGPFTVAGWIYLTSVASDNGASIRLFLSDFAGGGNNYIGFLPFGTGNYAVRMLSDDLRTNSIDGLIDMTPNWTHIGAVGNAGAISTLYTNGAAVINTLRPASAAADNFGIPYTKLFHNASTGDSGGPNGRAGNGTRMSDWRVYNRQLTAADMAKLALN